MVTQKPFAVFDIDGTVIRWQLFHAIVDALAREGHISQADYQAIRQARMTWKRRTHEESFKEYEQRLVDVYSEAVARLQVNDYKQAITGVFEEYKDQVYTYTRNLIRDLKARGYLLFALSGSQQEIVGMLAAYYGFDDWIGSRFEQVDGHFTGRVDAALGRKPELLKSLVAKHRAAFAGSVGVGDSEGDIDMLGLVENPIAFNPSKKLFAHAKTQGWKVILERKNMVYELEPHNGTYHLTD